MSGNVYSFQQAIDNGFEPRTYPYQKDSLTGPFKAKLDFKVWSIGQMAINCYFTVVGTKEKVLLAVYRKKDGSKAYKLPDCEIDFRDCPIQRIYEVTVTNNGAKGLRFMNATICEK